MSDNENGESAPVDKQSSARHRESQYPPAAVQTGLALLQADPLSLPSALGETWHPTTRRYFFTISSDILDGLATIVYDYYREEITNTFETDIRFILSEEDFLRAVRAAVQLRFTNIYAATTAETKNDWSLNPHPDFKLPRVITLLINRIGITTLRRGTARVYPALTVPQTKMITEDVINPLMLKVAKWMKVMVEGGLTVPGDIKIEPEGGAWWTCGTYKTPDPYDEIATINDADCFVIGAFDDIGGEDIVHASLVRVGHMPRFGFDYISSATTESQWIQEAHAACAALTAEGHACNVSPAIDPADPSDLVEVDARGRQTPKSMTDPTSTNFRPEFRPNFLVSSNKQGDLINRVVLFIIAN